MLKLIRFLTTLLAAVLLAGCGVLPIDVSPPPPKSDFNVARCSELSSSGQTVWQRADSETEKGRIRSYSGVYQKVCFQWLEAENYYAVWWYTSQASGGSYYSNGKRESIVHASPPTLDWEKVYDPTSWGRAKAEFDRSKVVLPPPRFR